jgi:hypothetical protein
VAEINIFLYTLQEYKSRNCINNYLSKQSKLPLQSKQIRHKNVHILLLFGEQLSSSTADKCNNIHSKIHKESGDGIDISGSSKTYLIYNLSVPESLTEVSSF